MDYNENSETCLKPNFGVMETGLYGETSSILSIWSSEDPKFKVLY